MKISRNYWVQSDCGFGREIKQHTQQYLTYRWKINLVSARNQVYTPETEVLPYPIDIDILALSNGCKFRTSQIIQSHVLNNKLMGDSYARGQFCQVERFR
jgi:hypothetical protein